jgi:hypothetical protein
VCERTHLLRCRYEFIHTQGTVHGFTTGYWWAAGIYFGGAVMLGALIRPRTRLHHGPGKPNPLEEPITVIS